MTLKEKWDALLNRVVGGIQNWTNHADISQAPTVIVSE